MRYVPSLLLVICFSCLLLAQTGTADDPWAPFRGLIGAWTGSGGRGSIRSKVEAEYKLVLGET
jgi:hypothetical protein